MSMEIEPIKLRMIEKVCEEIREILSHAEEEAKRILDEAREESRRILMSRLERRPEVRMIRSKIMGQVELEGKRMVIKAKDEVASRVFDEVERLLKDVVGGKDDRFKYDEILVKLVEEAVSGIGEREIVLAANKRDREFLLKNLSRLEEHLSNDLGYDVKLLIANEALNCLGGVIAHDKERRKIYYNTLEGRLLKLRRTMKAKVIRELLGGA